MIDVWMMFAMIIPFLEVLLYSYKHTLQNKTTGRLKLHQRYRANIFLTSYFKTDFFNNNFKQHTNIVKLLL